MQAENERGAKCGPKVLCVMKVKRCLPKKASLPVVKEELCTVLADLFWPSSIEIRK